jgi:D-alanyl-D-alanine carboxypeptidase
MSLKSSRKWPLLGLIVGISVIAMIAWHIGSNGSKSSSRSIVGSSFNKQQFPTDQARSLWAVINKGRILPSSYVPPGLSVPDVKLRLPASDPEMQLRADAAIAIKQLFTAAAARNIQLMLGSGYRSYTSQAQIYQSNVRTLGKKSADLVSARPGHSEHQAGLAADVEPVDRTCEFEDCFAKTPEGKWLAANSYQYGFIIRYQKGAVTQTGYQYEPWHIRYVGKSIAVEVHRTSQTLEQFFGLPAFSNYPVNPFSLKGLEAAP